MNRITNFLFVLIVTFMFSAGCDNSSERSTPGSSDMQSRYYWTLQKDEQDQTQDDQNNWNGIEDYDPNGNFYSFWSNARNYWGSTAEITMTGNTSNPSLMHYTGEWSLASGGCTAMGQGKATGSMWTMMNYTCDVSSAGSSFYVSLYGWMDCSDTGHPLVEYYVVENYHDNFFQEFAENPAYLGRYWMNGSYYKLYKSERVNKPWIWDGLGTFWQYWSVREDRRTSGTITFESHVFAWAAEGLTMGAFSHYQIMAIEGNSSTGEIEMTINWWY